VVTLQFKVPVRVLKGLNREAMLGMNFFLDA
jgi:hypothetical protein